MQEEVTQKTIALSMKTGKLTAQALQAALKKYLQHRFLSTLRRKRQQVVAQDESFDLYEINLSDEDAAE